MCAKSLQSCLTLCDPRDCRLSGFSVHGILQREYWSGFPCPSPGDHPDPGIEPTFLMSPAVAGRFFTTSATWEVSDVQEQFIINWKWYIHDWAWERQERRSKLYYLIAHLIHHSYYQHCSFRSHPRSRELGSIMRSWQKWKNLSFFWQKVSWEGVFILKMGCSCTTAPLLESWKMIRNIDLPTGKVYLFIYQYFVWEKYPNLRIYKGIWAMWMVVLAGQGPRSRNIWILRLRKSRQEVYGISLWVDTSETFTTTRIFPRKIWTQKRFGSTIK